MDNITELELLVIAQTCLELAEQKSQNPAVSAVIRVCRRNVQDLADGVRGVQDCAEGSDALTRRTGFRLIEMLRRRDASPRSIPEV